MPRAINAGVLCSHAERVDQRDVAQAGRQPCHEQRNEHSKAGRRGEADAQRDAEKRVQRVVHGKSKTRRGILFPQSILYVTETRSLAGSRAAAAPRPEYRMSPKRLSSLRSTLRDMPEQLRGVDLVVTAEDEGPANGQLLRVADAGSAAARRTVAAAGMRSRSSGLAFRPRRARRAGW